MAELKKVTASMMNAIHDLPLLVGWNADEGSLFAARVKLPPDAPSYADRIRAQFKDQADKVLQLYPPAD